MKNGGLWSSWTANGVKSRMIDAMRVLARLPETGRHKQIRCAWPDETYARDPSALYLDVRYEELTVRAELGDAELSSRYRDRMKRPPPHPAEIAKMEQALTWPAHYLDEQDCKIMLRWSEEVSRTGRSVQTAGELGITKQGMNKRILRLASIVAIGLIRDKVLPRL